MAEMILDRQRNISIDPSRSTLLNLGAIDSHRWGIHHLATAVRRHEQQAIDASPWPSGGSEIGAEYPHYEPFVYPAFVWFAISITAYLRLIALFDLANRRGWTEHHLVENREEVNGTCNAYVEDVIPAIVKWRHKIAAHPAATSPRRDTLGTLLESVCYIVGRTSGYFEVGRTVWALDGDPAEVNSWSLTKCYERLTRRYWPEDPLEPLRHRPGSEPSTGRGTWLVCGGE